MKEDDVSLSEFIETRKGQGEICNIIKKGVYDSIKLLNDISSEQDESLAERFMKIYMKSRQKPKSE